MKKWHTFNALGCFVGRFMLTFYGVTLNSSGSGCVPIKKILNLILEVILTSHGWIIRFWWLTGCPAVRHLDNPSLMWHQAIGCLPHILPKLFSNPSITGVRCCSPWGASWRFTATHWYMSTVCVCVQVFIRERLCIFKLSKKQTEQPKHSYQ